MRKFWPGEVGTLKGAFESENLLGKVLVDCGLGRSRTLMRQLTSLSLIRDVALRIYCGTSCRADLDHHNLRRRLQAESRSFRRRRHRRHFVLGIGASSQQPTFAESEA